MTKTIKKDCRNCVHTRGLCLNAAQGRATMYRCDLVDDVCNNIPRKELPDGKIPDMLSAFVYNNTTVYCDAFSSEPMDRKKSLRLR